MTRSIDPATITRRDEVPGITEAAWVWPCPRCHEETAARVTTPMEEIAADALCMCCRRAAGELEIARSERYTQYEWEMLCFSHRAEPDRYMAGDDPQGWTVDGVHGQALNPDDDSDDVLFVED